MILKNCPKCGSYTIIEEGEDIGIWLIRCGNLMCNCRMVRYRDGNKKSRAAAVRAWNSYEIKERRK